MDRNAVILGTFRAHRQQKRLQTLVNAAGCIKISVRLDRDRANAWEEDRRVVEPSMWLWSRASAQRRCAGASVDLSRDGAPQWLARLPVSNSSLIFFGRLSVGMD
jgi:hypothetical protein